MISTKKLISIVLGIAFIAISNLVIANITDYLDICKVSSLIIVLFSLLVFFSSKKKLTAINIIYLCFVLFQFGLPLLYAFDSSYTNWNINQFSNDNLVWSVKFTTICIEFFGLGILLFSNKIPKKQEEKNNFLSDENSKIIYSVGKFIFIITAPICFGLGIYVAYLASIHGYNYIKVDSMGIYNSLTRICQELIVPALLLLIIYAPNKKTKNKYVFLSLLYSIILIFTGARTVSLALVLVILLLSIDNNNNKIKFRYKILTILGIFIIVSAGTFVAQYRFYGNTSTFKFSTVIQSVVEEMGFNFTSLPFTRIFIPSVQNFEYGNSYIYSIICLIPRTLDPFGYIESIHNYLPERWLASVLHLKYGKTFDYGVGYSVIAESYYNFGRYGFISVFIQSIIINKLLNSEVDNKFKKYIKYIMLFSLITYPRRSFETLLKSLEYCVVLIVIIIFVFSYKKRKEKSLESNC